MILPRPETADQITAVQVVWKHLRDHGKWPTFNDIDHSLKQWHSIVDADRVLAGMPLGVLHGVRPGRPDLLGPDQEVGLTVAGALATGQAAEELELFRRAVRLAGDVEHVFQPELDHEAGPRQPVLSADEFSRRLLRGRDDQQVRLARLLALLRIEPWGGVYQPGEPWTFVVGREVRRYRGMNTIEDYWRLRPPDTPPDDEPDPVPDPAPRWERVLPILIPGVSLAFAAVNTPQRAAPILGLGVAAWIVLLPWRGRRWVRSLGAVLAAVCAATLVWSYLPRDGSRTPPTDADPAADIAPTPGTCAPVGGTVCRYLRLADGQAFNLTRWGSADGSDVRLSAPDTLSPAGGTRLSPVTAGKWPLDPRSCWTMGRWTNLPQRLTEGTRVCLWIPSGQFALLTLTARPAGARYRSRFAVAVTTPSTEAQPLAGGRLVTIDNRVTDGMRMREDTALAKLRVMPDPYCGDGCVVEDTDMPSGARVTAVCHRQGAEVTNEDKSSSVDDGNPGIRSSMRWFGVRWPDGRTGLVSEVWVRGEDLGGSRLPPCP
ncbi:hypothetical protein [Micromonospora chalcea]|uniref:hypothetical protein n=1 Tax=Micromonospora chalcea TaxID=1874 RepID=UPI003D74FCA1